MDSDPDDDSEDATASRRDVLKGTAAAAATAGLGLGGFAGNAAASNHTQQFRVRVENVSTPNTIRTSQGSVATPLSPGVYAVHDGPAPMFDGLQPASDGLEALAEDGVPSGLASEVQAERGVSEAGAFATGETVADPNDPTGQVPGAPPIFPGGAFEFTVSAAPGDSLSLATMLVQTNDVFIAPDVQGIDLFEGRSPISGDVTDQLYHWDAGTEVDQEPGVGPDQAPRQSARDTGPSERSGVVPLSIAEFGGHSLPDVSDVIRVTVTPLTPQPLDVRVENVASTETYPANTSTGGAVWVTPGGVAVHEGDNPIFEEGQPASPGLELLAEAGPPGDLVPEVAADSDVETATAYTPADTVADPNDPKGSVPGAPPIAPDGAFEFRIQATPGEKLSLASMFVPSNDLFLSPGGDGIDLFENGSPAGDVSDEIGLWDAGTEVNGEPGVDPDGAPAQSSADQGTDENGVVRPIADVNDGFDYPAAEDTMRVVVTEPGQDLPTRRFRVRIENDAPTNFYGSNASTGGAIWITPGAFAVHPGMNPIFVEGREASAGLELLAEAGPPSDLVPELASDPRVESAGAYTPADTVADPNDPKGSVPGAPPIAPGGAFEFEVEAEPGHRLSFASMFVPSNDVFFAPGQSGVHLFENGGAVSGDVSGAVELWDAGTEPNGKPGFGPDQAPAQSSPDQGADEGGVVRNLDDVNDGYTYPNPEDAITVTLTPL